MIESNDQTLEYIGYQVPKKETDANGQDPENPNQVQGNRDFSSDNLG